MLIGYVSDERYVALPDVPVEIEAVESGVPPVATHSTATGKIVADIPAGKFRVTLNKDGYSEKTVEVELSQDRPYQFRLLKKQLLGYGWPKWIKSGERAEFRVHSPAANKISLWRYGWRKELVQPLGTIPGWPVLCLTGPIHWPIVQDSPQDNHRNRSLVAPKLLGRLAGIGKKRQHPTPQWACPEFSPLPGSRNCQDREMA